MIEAENQESIASPEETELENTDLNSEEVTQNAGARSAATNVDPRVSLEEARNATEGKATNAAGSVAPSTAEEHIPSTSDPNATDLPTAR